MVEELGVAVVYHWWDMSDTPVQRSSFPIIPAIASLRAVNKKVPIYVLDSSGFTKNWNGYPEKYDFYVVKWPFEVRNYMDLGENANDTSLSILMDVWKFSTQWLKEGIIVYCDTDTFWLEDALPVNHLSSNQVSFGAESGVICFNKKEVKIERFFELYKAYAITALHNEQFCRQVSTLAGSPLRVPRAPTLNRKNLLAALENERPYWFNKLPPRYSTGWGMGEVASPKMLHVSDLKMQNPGECLALIQELYDNIERSDLLTEYDWIDFYGTLRFAKLREWQVSLQNDDFKKQLRNHADMRSALERVHRTTIRTV
jgi:hypothetical protein